MDSYELTRLAKEQGRTDIVDWIAAEIEKARVARETELAVPVETPVGQLVPGVRYNVTLKGASYGSRAERVLRDVTVTRGGYSPRLVYPSGKTAVHLSRLVYPSGKTAVHLFGGDAKRITSIEKCGDTLP